MEIILDKLEEELEHLIENEELKNIRKSIQNGDSST